MSSWVEPVLGIEGKKVREYNQEITRQTHGIVRKSHTRITRHQEDKQSKAISSLFSIEMIAKLEWTQSKAQQNIEHKTKHKTQQEIELHNPTMGVTINNESTTTESLLQMTQCGSTQRPLDHLKSSTLPQSHCAPPNRYTGYNVLCFSGQLFSILSYGYPKIYFG